MNYTAFVFARGGSKGLPGKNVRELAGKPLIAWAIETALAVDRIERVVVSTDSPEIAEVARRFGAETPFMRPDELAADSSAEWMSWQHALAQLEALEGTRPPAIVSVPTTAPLRSVDDIAACLDTFEEHQPDAVITVVETSSNPYFKMVQLDGSGHVHRFLDGEAAVVRRQDAPRVLEITSVAYVADADFVMRSTGLFDGVLRAVEIPQSRALDIDTPWDFTVAECALSNSRGNEAP